jgi:Alternative complex III, ActD subunit
MSAVYGLYPDGHAAQRAVDALRAIGVADEQITVITSYPMEEFAFFQHDGSRWEWWMACLGGLVGLSAASALLWIGETSWPMNVGGLPVFAWWPNLIIMFELTMLGAILATVATLVVTARLGSGSTLYDPEVSQDQILVGVEKPTAETVRLLQKALEAPGGARVKQVPSGPRR